MLTKKNRFALCIGNNKYSYMEELTCAVNDAVSIGEALQKLNFEVVVMENTELDTLIEAISALEQKIREYEAILVFFAGHGFQINGQNFLAPIDFNPNYDPAHAMYKAFRMNDLMVRIGGNAEKAKIIILDACREEYKARGISGNEFAPMYAPQGTLIAFSTSPGQVAKESKEHGKYTELLLKYIDLPREPIESVFKRVRTDLVRNTGGTQTPWEHTSLIGDFYLNPGEVSKYNERAYADKYYEYNSGSIIKPIVDELRSYNWNRQREALRRILLLDFNKTTSDELFILGRNIYQAADGGCFDAKSLIQTLKEEDAIPDHLKIHMLNGMAYEIYFNHDDQIRREPKDGYASKVINLLEDKSFISSCEFISTILLERKIPIYYLPGSKKKIVVTVKLEEVDTTVLDSFTGEMCKYDGYGVNDIIFEGESIYFCKSSNDKPVVSDPMFESKIKKFVFEAELARKMIVSEGYLAVDYEGAEIKPTTLLLVPREGYSVFKRK